MVRLVLRVNCLEFLIADDNDDMRLYIARLLSKGFEVEHVSDGQAALESAIRRPPDLILTDVMIAEPRWVRSASRASRERVYEIDSSDHALGPCGRGESCRRYGGGG